MTHTFFLTTGDTGTTNDSTTGRLAVPAPLYKKASAPRRKIERDSLIKATNRLVCPYVATTGGCGTGCGGHFTIGDTGRSLFPSTDGAADDGNWSDNGMSSSSDSESRLENDLIESRVRIAAGITITGTRLTGNAFFDVG